MIFFFNLTLDVALRILGVVYDAQLQQISVVVRATLLQLTLPQWGEQLSVRVDVHSRSAESQVGASTSSHEQTCPFYLSGLFNCYYFLGML